ncbi:hypothetical protein TNCV_3825721 [Trichonephila clavipes]|nr:hypothetical protein TNCV_3825721 [Trichonephila clavipes]
MLTLMGIKIGPEAHGFAVKYLDIRIEYSEIRASDVSKDTRTALLEERTSENAVFEVQEGPTYGTRIVD